jgi:hypothetical protein
LATTDQRIESEVTPEQYEIGESARVPLQRATHAVDHRLTTETL